MRLPRFPLCCLVLACLFYGAFSSPTPDNPGLFEGLIGLCLIGAIGFESIIYIATGAILFDPKAVLWCKIGVIVMFYMVIVPTILAILYGQSMDDIVRDLIPLLYAFLPVMLISTLNRMPNAAHILWLGLIAIGVLFAARYFIVIGRLPWQVGHKTYHDDFLYLPLSPEVLFAALSLLTLAITRFMRKSASPVADFCIAGATGLLGGLCVASLAGLLLRASVVLIIAVTGVVFLSSVKRAPRRTWFAFAIAGLIFATVGAKPVKLVLSSLSSKEDAVGINQRDNEFKTATAPLLAEPAVFLFGLGWGATVPSPAVGNLRVPYTHNFFSYLLMKSGVIGTLAMLVYFIVLLTAILKGQKQNWIVFIPAIIPLALAFTLYTSYKTLGFGLILSYAASLSVQINKNRQSHGNFVS